MTTTNGTWTGDATIVFTYQWQRDNSGGGTFGNISSATASTYLLTNTDANCAVRCVVTGTNGAGAVSANSNATAAIHVNIGTPVERYAARVLVNAGSQVISPATTVAAGTRCILFNGSSDLVTAVTDSVGNTWSVHTSHAASVVKGMSIASCLVATQITSANTITITYAGTNNLNRENYLIEVSGLAASPYDTSFWATGANGTSVSIGPTSTLAQANEIAFLFFEEDQVRTFTPTGGFTGSTTVNNVTAHLAYKIVAATTAVTGTGTLSNNAQKDGYVAAFKGLSLA